MKGKPLPPEVAHTLVALRDQGDRIWLSYVYALHKRGYSLATISQPLGVSRQRVHRIVRVCEHRRVDVSTLDLPMPPRVLNRPPRRNPKTVPVLDAATLRGLWDISSSRRGSTPKGAPSATASTQLAMLVRKLLGEGYSFEDMAHAADIDARLLRNRMLRAGIRARGNDD